MRVIRSGFLAMVLLSAYATLAQTRNFSPWLVIKGERELMSYVAPIIKSGVGDHISLFVKPDKYPADQWQNFIKKCHDGGIETVYLSVTGSEKSFDTKAAMERTVGEWLTKAAQYSFDGIDMDIENLDPGVRAAHTRFIRYASQRLHDADLKLAMAVGYYPPMIAADTGQVDWWYDPQVIGQYCDRIRIMLYGQYTGRKVNDKHQNRPDMSGMGPTCSYSYASQALKFWTTYVPKEKLTVNIPAFSTVFYLSPGREEPVLDDFTRKKGKSYYPSPQGMDSTKAVYRYWSWIERVWVYTYTSVLDGSLQVFYASDEDSTAQLLHLLEATGIESVGMWIYTGDNAPEWYNVNQMVLEWSRQ